MTVDSDGRLSAVRGRALVRARRDGVDRYVLSFDLGPGGDTRQVYVEPLQNCRLGAVRRHPVTPVLVAELHFDERLRAGDTWMFEYRMVDPDGTRCWEYARGISHPIFQYLLEVQFDPSAIPLDCHVYARTDLDGKAVRLRELTVNRHHAVHHVARDVSAGVLGVAWSWPEEIVPGGPSGAPTRGAPYLASPTWTTRWRGAPPGTQPRVRSPACR